MTLRILVISAILAVPASMQAQGNAVPAPRLGVGLSFSRPLTQYEAQQLGFNDTSVAVVNGVLPGGAAERAGVLVEDGIVMIDGKPVASPAALSAAIEGSQVGSTVTLQVRRKSETFQIRLQVALTNWPEPKIVRGIVDASTPQDDPGLTGFGIFFEPVAEGTAKGVAVRHVSPQGVAARTGMITGDIVFKVGGVDVNGAVQVVDLLKAVKAGESARIVFRRHYADGSSGTRLVFLRRQL